MSEYDEIKKSLQTFDEFVNTAISANLKNVDVLQVVTAYNTIRTFINQKIEFDKAEDSKD